MLDVLLLLPVSRWLLEGLDNERRGGGNNRDGGLTVLDGQLDGDAKTLPVTGGFGDIFTDLYRLLAEGPHGRIRITHSSARDREDRSWEREQMRHRLHHQWLGGG